MKMKMFLATAAISMGLCQPIKAQLFGSLTNTPQHVFVLGGGVGPTSKDFSVLGGFAEKLPTSTATYSYSGVNVVPALISNQNGSKSLAVTTVAATGLKQILFQQGRFTAAVDGSAGVSLPSTGTTAFNFAAVGGVDLIWRLNKKLNPAAGGSNNYIAVQPTFTQLTGTSGGTVVSLAIAWIHGVNGQ